MSEHLSFYKLFVDKNYTIEIPIIQRDYAQGRNSVSEIRNDFLNALYEYLDKGKSGRDLDFVYGDVDSKNKFIPLDGQQRLTTLFLLHYYLAVKEGFATEFKAVLYEKDKSKFTYKTRQSATDFCNALLKNPFSIKNLLLPDDEKFNAISKTIKDSKWYFLTWDSDLTIQSMLCMLDAIHNKFKDRLGFYKKLIDPENPVITFHFLPLSDYGLTDDLYIKMNSRGKPLTKFENFKAKFEQHLNKYNNDLQYFLLDFNSTDFKSIEEYFSHKIDTQWADLFWSYRNIKDNIYDDQIMNFINTIAINHSAIYRSDIKQYIDNQENINLKFYLNLSKDCIKTLINSFDLFSISETFTQRLVDFHYYNDIEAFKTIINRKFTDTGYLERIQFFAYYSYLVKWQGNDTGLSDWMRVIVNLSENTVPYNNEVEFSNSISSINKLLPDSNNVLEHLKSKHSIAGFTSEQIKEERIKAYLITKDENWNNEIKNAEKHAYFKGQLTFALNFSGIEDFYDTHNNSCNWSDIENETYFLHFKNYILKVFSLFNSNGLVEKAMENHLWHRAVLSKGDYLIYAKSNYSFLIDKERDISWKRLLLGDGVRKTNRELVKRVLDDNKFAPDDLNSLSLFLVDIDETLPVWVRKFIEQPALFNYLGREKFIRYYNLNQIFLLKGVKMSGEHVELFSYSLFLKLKDTFEYSPFKNFEYYPVSGESDSPRFFLNGLCFNENNIRIRVFYEADGNYNIIVIDEKGIIISEIIKEILVENKLTESSSSFKILTKEDDVQSCLKNLCNSFRDLT